MTENTSTRTVQSYRHEARDTLVEARKGLALRTEGTKEVYTLLNGTIESVIKGAPGYSQEEQVRRLSEALETAQGNREALAEAVANAKAEVQAQIDSWEADFAAALDATVAVLEEAKTFAAERDFDAWQAQKGRNVSEPSDEDDEYDEDPEPEEV